MVPSGTFTKLRLSSMSSAAITVAGQGLSSLSNMLVQFAFVWALSTSDFGWVVISFSVYYFVIAIGRAGIGDAAVSVSDKHDTGWPWMWKRSLALGLLAALISVGVALAADGGRNALLILSGGFALMVAQDALRYRCWALGRPERVVWLELVWIFVGVLSAGLGLFVSGSSWDGTVIAAAWVLGGLVSIATGLMFGWHRHVTDAPVAIDDARRAGRSYVVDQAPIAVLSQVLPIAIALVAGTVATAEYRLAFLPFMAVESILLGFRVRLLPSLHPSRPPLGGRLSHRIRVTVIFGGLALVLATVTTLVAIGPLRSRIDSLSGIGWLVLLAAFVIVTRAVGRPSADYAAVRIGSRRMASVRGRWTLFEFATAVVCAIPFGVAGVLLGRAVVGSLATTQWIRLGASIERTELPPRDR